MLSGDVLGGCPALTDDAGGAAAQSTTAPESVPRRVPGPLAPSSANTAPPVHISIPSIGVSSDLVGLDRGEDGWIQAPADYDAVGWYEKGVLPGEVGPAVIAATSTPPPGRQCSSTSPDSPRGTPWRSSARTVRRRISSSPPADRGEGQLPDRVHLPPPTPTPQLRLVTCAGAWDPASGHYVDNLVVTAVAA